MTNLLSLVEPQSGELNQILKQKPARLAAQNMKSLPEQREGHS
jgi:hypothetical protein